MPKLILNTDSQYYQFEFTPGLSLRDILDESDHRVRTACLGHGACGLCRVRIETALLPPSTSAERLHIAAHQLALGTRLACQFKPENDLQVTILNPVPASNWKSISAWKSANWNNVSTDRKITVQKKGSLRFSIPEHVHHPLAIAIDLGTTNIRIAVIDLLHNRWLAMCRGANPQGTSGADVLSRISVATESEENRKNLSQQVVNASGEALQVIAKREGIDLQRVIYVELVANTAMLALMTGDAAERLLLPQNWIKALQCHPLETKTWKKSWAIHQQATIHIVQPLAGFVGSDLLAGLLATRLVQGVAPALFIDFGTNSEMALWDGKELRVTSAAGGPAFEASGYSYGMPAEKGAIYRVQMKENKKLHYQVIGEKTVQGICGSGLVDLVARLRELGLLTAGGRFVGQTGFEFPDKADITDSVDNNRETLKLTVQDVDNLQQAKAAIAAAILILCQQSKLHVDQFQRICISGEFGRYLDISSACAIGLLPPVAPDKIELFSEAPLLGCTDLILNIETAEQLHLIRQKAQLINLALEPEFEILFVENLYLQRMKNMSSI
jgi:uncharacterized 2Fe-2S/4Fe-4S cluster protein (DUF4445 family)